MTRPRFWLFMVLGRGHIGPCPAAPAVRWGAASLSVLGPGRGFSAAPPAARATGGSAGSRVCAEGRGCRVVQAVQWCTGTVSGGYQWQRAAGAGGTSGDGER